MGTVHYMGNAKTVDHYQSRADLIQSKSQVVGFYLQRFMDASKEMFDAQCELNKFCSSYGWLKHIVCAEKIRDLKRQVELTSLKYDKCLKLVTSAREELHAVQFGEDKPFLI